MWSVVCFLTDNTIDTVPNFWCKNGICSYPNKASMARKYIKRRVNPNVLEFSKFKVEVLHQNVGLYTNLDLIIDDYDNYIKCTFTFFR